MKVLLIRPRPHRETIGLQHVMICEPLELEYLSSNVPDKIRDLVDIKIIDLIVEKKKMCSEMNSLTLFYSRVT